MPVTLGCERLIASGALSGARIGIVANPASVDTSFRHISDRVASESGATLVALFGPQHGFYGDSQDNMVETAHSRDPRLDVPIYSLYSDTREPTPNMLKEIDVVVIDLQDVGTRVYTYIYTMANCLRAAAREGIRVVVCDRPNPIGGTAVEGPVLKTALRSFVGQFAIPLRHGMTIGELARLFNDHFEIGADLDVVPVSGWSRTDYLNNTGVPWIIPSPNLPTLDSATVYPGTVLIEGTTLSEGRGTTRPFELVGAPWLEPESLALQLNTLELPGVHFRPVTFKPTFQKHAGQTCGGCQIHVIDRSSFKPVLCGVAFIVACKRADRQRFGWLKPPYEYEREKMPIDILAGTDQFRLGIDNGRSAVDIAQDWQRELTTFHEVRKQFLLY